MIKSLFKFVTNKVTNLPYMLLMTPFMLQLNCCQTQQDELATEENFEHMNRLIDQEWRLQQSQNYRFSEKYHLSGNMRVQRSDMKAKRIDAAYERYADAAAAQAYALAQ